MFHVFHVQHKTGLLDEQALRVSCIMEDTVIIPTTSKDIIYCWAGMVPCQSALLESLVEEPS